MGSTVRAIMINIHSKRFSANLLRTTYMKLNQKSSSITFQRCMSFQKKFEEAQSNVGSLSEEPGNDAKLKMYGLFKQASMGSPKIDRPGITNFVGRAKWDAWNVNKDMDKETAQKAYIALVDSLSAAENKEAAVSQSGEQRFKNLLIEVNGGLRKIIFNRPKKMNAFTFEMYKEIESALHEAKEDPKTVITAITGAGPYFCSGNDLSNFQVTPDRYEEVAEYTKVNLKRFVGVFIDFPKPLIAVVNGPAVGIGVTILGLCDAVYATDKATFLTPFTSLGQSPEGCSSVIFPRIMGYGKSSEFLMFNKKITAMDAYQRNLVTEVFPDEVLQQEIWPRLQAYAKFPVKSMIYAKELVRGVDRKDLHKVNEAEWERLRERITSEDCMNAIAKFFMKK